MNASKKLFIYYNDSTDPDNTAATVLWATMLKSNPSLVGMFILEPRHVSLGLSMTPDKVHQCQKLLEKYKHYWPMLPSKASVTLLRGSLSWKDLEKVDNIEEREILKFAVKPEAGEHEDALLHARLLALDQSTYIRRIFPDQMDIFINEDCVEHFECPLNLHRHHHEELVARTETELKNHDKIMRLSLKQRAPELRAWYIKAVNRRIREHQRDPIRHLDIHHLTDQIKSFDDTIFFGGASLTIMQRLLELDSEIGKRISYYQQGGTFDPKLNILDLPYNFALNPQAAAYILKNHDKLRNFVLVPTDSARKVKYSLQSLKEVCPNIHKAAQEFAHGDSTDVVLADLTALVLCFTTGLQNIRSTITVTSTVRSGGAAGLQLLRDANAAMKAVVLNADHPLVITNFKNVLDCSFKVEEGFIQ